MYDAYHAVRNLSATVGDDEARERSPVTIAGPICESADVLCEQRPLPRPERGETLAIGNAGAYGYEMSNTYNSRPRPAEVALSGTTVRLARRRETITDLAELER
jgi:diaminopimelate decarboxylase